MKYCCSLILFLFLANCIIAQDSSKTNQNELKHGIQFQIRSLLELTNFDGYTFSYRYRINYKSGIRIGLYTNINKSDDDITQRLDNIVVNPPNYNHNYNFKLSAQYLFDLINYKSFALVFGGGPFISYTKSETSTEYLYTSYSVKHTRKDKSTGFGLDLILGVEYILTDNIILSGEYGLTIDKENSDIDEADNYIYSDVTQNRISTQKGKRDILIINGMGVNLGISFFF